MRIKENGRPFRTSQRNFVLDCRFDAIPDPVSLGAELRQIIGVVEHGLFVGLTNTAIIGRGDSVEIISGESGS